ncbi:MAG: GNAT family N-acetyltransferase [Candidatus Saliniplasma sp.]
MSINNLEIRKFVESDYAHIVRLENNVFPDIEISEESLKFNDKSRSEKCKHQRYMMELEDEIIGHGFYNQWEGSYQPGKFFIYGAIHPAHQEMGYGTEIYRYILDELANFEPVKLVCHTKEDKERAIKFIEDRGFKETMRMWELELDVNSFSFGEYEGLREKLGKEGIVLTSLEELGIDEENNRKLYELYEKVMKDVPMSDEYTGIEFQRFIEFFEHPYFIPEAYIIAVRDDEFIGLSNHWFLEEQNALSVGMTGVRKDYRGDGIATAMKVKAIEIASDKGISTIKTENETGNEDMLHINEKLGFERKPAWINYEKTL